MKNYGMRIFILRFFSVRFFLLRICIFSLGITIFTNAAEEDDFIKNAYSSICQLNYSRRAICKFDAKTNTETGWEFLTLEQRKIIEKAANFAACMLEILQYTLEDGTFRQAISEAKINCEIIALRGFFPSYKNKKEAQNLIETENLLKFYIDNSLYPTEKTIKFANLSCIILPSIRRNHE